MGYKPQGPDIFTLKQGYVECVSGSGHTYKVTHDSCSCKGFGFRRECRHYRQAKQKGLLNKLEVQIVKKASYKPSVFTGHMKKMRMDAIRTFLNKHNIRYKPTQVIDIEKILTVNSTRQDIFAFFF
jgi:ribosomal protein L37E